MADNQLNVTERTSFGKGSARKLRAAGFIPAVVYGHGSEPRHLALPGHETMLIVRQANAVLELQVEGGDEILALVKDVQRDPVRQIIEHVDLIIVRRGERVEVDVPVIIEGEPADNMLAMQDATTLLVSADALKIPESITVSVEGLEEGTVVMQTDVALPEGVQLVDEEAELVVVSISAPVEQDLGDEPEAEGEEGEAGEAAEGEAEGGDADGDSEGEGE